MATHDYTLANQVGSDARTDLNNLFQAIVSQNSSATEPATMYAYMWWADTANDILKQRNSANTVWISMMTLSTGVMLQKDTSSGIAGLTLFKINFKNALNTFTSFFTNSNTAARTYTFPDRDITVAGVDDITGITTTTTKLPTITATQATGAITVSASSMYLDFRSTTLTSGTISTVLAAPSNLVIPDGATLGSVTTVAAEIVVIEMNNAGTAELAVVNLSGGNDLSERGLISTTAIGTGSDSANVIYSTTARTNLTYRVVGSFTAVNTAGTWASPTLVQGAGGNALSAMSSAGYGQTWQSLTGSRVVGTTYYSGWKPIKVSIALTSNPATPALLTVGGITAAYAQYASAAGIIGQISADIPPYTSYVLSGANQTITQWSELR